MIAYTKFTEFINTIGETPITSISRIDDELYAMIMPAHTKWWATYINVSIQFIGKSQTLCYIKLSKRHNFYSGIEEYK